MIRTPLPRALVLGFATLLIFGCSVPGVRERSESQLQGPDTRGALTERSADGSISGEPIGGWGFLQVTVRWPKRDLPGFQAQVIPQRTNSIRLTVTGSQDAVAYRATIPRAVGVAAATTSVRLEAGLGYGMKAEAFAESQPTDTSTSIAWGNAVNVPILKSKITQVPITLTAVNAPAITLMSPTAGPYGSEIAISGKNFGETLSLPFLVTLGGVTLASTRLSDTTATASVPLGASGGNIVVSVDGVLSETVALFSVTEGVAVNLAPIEDTYGSNGFGVAVEATSSADGLTVTIQ